MQAEETIPAVAQPRGCTNFKLRQLTRQVSRYYDAELAQAGLKTTQYSLLSHVATLGPLRAGDLAAAMGLDASTLSRNLKPLEQSGYLVLEQGTDARSRLVGITEAGLACRAQAQRFWKRAQQGLNKKLGTERVAALHALIDDSMTALQDKP